jgi:serine/threonine protein phosphatase PrpC
VSLALLEQLSLPGDPAKPNEDSFARLDHAALVLDGATPLGPPLLPGPSDAAWIAQFGARRLAAHLKDGDAPDQALRHALQDAERSFAGLSRQPIREKWQTPCASLMLAVELGRDLPPPRARSALEGEVVVAGPRASEDRRGSQIEFLWFGDCAALIEHDGKVEIVGETIQKRKAEAARARKVMREKNLQSVLGLNRPEIAPLLRAARNRINSGSNWLFSPDVRAATHVTKKTMTVKPGARLLLASDGFLALVSDYGAYDARGLMDAAAAKGLAALGEELRGLEKSDQDGRKFPRFKTSDDATALLLRLV